MAGIGEVSAILAFIQIGFSFAKALDQYVRDVKDVPKEVAGLPDRLFEVLGLVDEVSNLLSLNQKTQAWTEAGVRRAQGDIQYCQGIIRTLQEVLQKANVPLDSHPTKEDINISAFDKATWPFTYKPKIKGAKQDLERFYSRVSVTILTYQVRTSTSQFQRAGSEKKLARLLAKEMYGPIPSTGKAKHMEMEPEEAFLNAVNAIRKSEHRKDLHRLDSDADDNLDDICDMLKELARTEVVREEEEVKSVQDALQKLQEKAVKEWQATTKHQIEEHEKCKAQLRSELSGKLENDTVDRIVVATFPPKHDTGLIDPSNLIAMHSTGADPSKTTGASPATSGFKRLFSRGAAIRPSEMDAELREMISPGARASLKGFALAYDREQRIQKSPMGMPQQVLAKRLFTTLGNNNTNIPRAMPWDEYALLPYALRDSIDDERINLGGDWTLVHVERLMSAHKRNLFRRTVEQLQGVHIIFYCAKHSPAAVGSPAQLNVYSERGRRHSRDRGDSASTGGSYGRRRSTSGPPFKDKVFEILHRGPRASRSRRARERDSSRHMQPSRDRSRSHSRARRRSRGPVRYGDYIPYYPPPPTTGRRYTQPGSNAYGDSEAPNIYGSPAAMDRGRETEVPIYWLRDEQNLLRRKSRASPRRQRSNRYDTNYDTPASYLQTAKRVEEGREYYEDGEEDIGQRRGSIGQRRISNLTRSRQHDPEINIVPRTALRWRSSASFTDHDAQQSSRSQDQGLQFATDQQVSALLSELTTAAPGTDLASSAQVTAGAVEPTAAVPAEECEPSYGHVLEPLRPNNTEGYVGYRPPAAESDVEAR